MTVLTTVAVSPLLGRTPVHHQVVIGGDAKPMRFFVHKPDREVKGVLVALYAGYDAAPKRLARELEGKTDVKRGKTLTRWATDNGFAVMVWDTNFMAQEKPWWGTEQADLTPELRPVRDRFIDLHCEAMHEGMEYLAKKHNLPESNFIIAGSSKGAIWGCRFLNRYPKRFVAALIQNGHGFETDPSRSKDVAMFFSSGEYDYGRIQTMHYYWRHREVGGASYYHVMPGKGHAYPASEEKLHCDFLDYYFERKHGAGNVTQQLLADLDGSQWFYDCINLEVFAANKRDWIPTGQRIPLPVEDFATRWLVD